MQLVYGETGTVLMVTANNLWVHLVDHVGRVMDGVYVVVNTGVLFCMCL